MLYDSLDPPSLSTRRETATRLQVDPSNMNHQFKGGNSRLLARLLDQIDQPIAILDRVGQIIFANAALCQLAGAEATTLVSKQCSWQIAEDSPLAAILTGLAPPQGALDGRAIVRRLLAPIVLGSAHTGQLFLPIKNSTGDVESTLVLLGEVDQLQRTVAADAFASQRSQPDRTLVQIRSRWKSLDGLLALTGSSPAIELAMQRCQIAITNTCSVFISGPAGVGKHELAQGLFLGRLKSASVSTAFGQCFPIDCRKLDAELVDSMLEIFSGRLRADAPRVAHQLILTGVDRLPEASLHRVLIWLDRFQQQATVVSTSSQSIAELSAQGEPWAKLVSRLAAIELRLPGLASRRQDIAPLALQYLSEACKKADRAQLTLSNDALNQLEAFSWPDNLRQLRSAMSEAVKAAVLTSAVQTSHLPVAIRTYASSVANNSATAIEPIDLDAVLVDVEKVMLRRALKLSPRNRARAARLLGISRPRLLRRIEQLGLADHAPNLIDDDEEDANDS
jgi:transcriptional regulator with PAS, ATPase and Fis domain